MTMSALGVGAMIVQRSANLCGAQFTMIFSFKKIIVDRSNYYDFRSNAPDLL